LVLACLTIVLATIVIWVHEVAMDTDRFTALVTEVAADPAVIDPISDRVSQQVVTALDVESRVAALLPGSSARLAGPITAAVQEAIDRRLERVLENPDVQAALLRSLSFSHEHLVAFLRGDDSAFTLVDGYLYLDVWPVIGSALTEIQSLGFLPSDVQLPDLSGGGRPGALASRLQSALGVTLPPDFGTIRLVEAQRLATAQQVVQFFDGLTVVLVALAVALSVLALWLARDRRRMLVYLAVGTVIAFVIARLAVRGLATFVVNEFTESGLAPAINAVVAAAVTDLIGLTTIVLVAAAALAIVAYIAGRPAWLRRLASRSGGAVTGSARAAEQGVLERVGVGTIIFALTWIAIGIEVALLGALLVGAWLLIVQIISGPETPDGSGASA